MLKPSAFANSLAMLCAAFMVLLGLGQLWLPNAFAYFFNAQFFGANVSSLLGEMALPAFLGVLVTITVTAWVSGYVWAFLYNRMAK